MARQPAGGALIEAGDRIPLAGGPPPEYGGSSETWSPEHLLVSAAALCYLTTLEWFVARSELALLDFHCEAEGTVEKTPRGLAFTSVRLAATATAPAGQGHRLRELMDRAKGACLVASSLACPVELDAQVLEEAVARAG